MNNKGFYGPYGGIFVPEILYPVIEELIEEFNKIKDDPSFWKEYHFILKNYSGRPTPLTFAANLTKHFGTAKIYLKREDLNHSGAHKINNVIGQGILTKRMNKTRIIAETGAGQHGVATAIMAAKLGLEAVIYMGAEDVRRQYPNVFWMKKMGAKVVPVEYGSGTLKDAINEALRDWATNFETTHYCLGTACGPHPFPEMVREFHKIISKEARSQILDAENQLPKAVYACVGGGSNALGIFDEFIPDEAVELVGVEAGGRSSKIGDHAARIAYKQATLGVCQGYKTLFLQNEDGQMIDTHSISAGLDYIGISPILADLHDKGRVRFEAAPDDEVVEAVKLMALKEGIISALESAHGVARAFKEMPRFTPKDTVIINLSGRGDKDIFTVAEAFQDKEWTEFIKSRSEEYGND